MEVLCQLLDVPSGEVAFAVQNAVAEADVGAEEPGEIAGGQAVFGEEELECFHA